MDFSIGLYTGVQRQGIVFGEYRTVTALVVYYNRCEIVQVREAREGEWKQISIKGGSEYRGRIKT